MSCRNLLLLLVTLACAACGDDESQPRASSVLQLNGTYRPTESGAIGEISFSNNQDYVLLPAGCAGGECADIGTYRLDADNHLLYLRSRTTQRERTMTFDALAIEKAGAGSLVKSSLSPRDSLVNTGSTTTTTGNETTSTDSETTSTDNQTTSTEKDLTEDAKSLFDVVTAANLNGQGVQRGP